MTAGVKQALAVYRRRSGPNMQEEVKAFNKLPLNDRIEMLFWMLLHSNAQVSELSEEVGLDMVNLNEQPKEN